MRVSFLADWEGNIAVKCFVSYNFLEYLEYCIGSLSPVVYQSCNNELSFNALTWHNPSYYLVINEEKYSAQKILIHCFYRRDRDFEVL